MRNLIALISMCLIAWSFGTGCGSNNDDTETFTYSCLMPNGLCAPEGDLADGGAAKDAADAADMSEQGDAADTDHGNADALTCDNVVQKWSEFVAENVNCQQDSDCTIVSDWAESCDCHPSLTDGGVGLNVNARSEAQRYLETFHSDECTDVAQWHEVCDSGPTNEVRCDEGTCRASGEDCEF